MNLMSSIAKTLVGSTIAMVSVAPVRLTGTTRYFCATSEGISLMTASSISKWRRLIEGTPYCSERRSVMSSSRTNPILTRLYPSFPPLFFWCSRASVSWSWLM